MKQIIRLAGSLGLSLFCLTAQAGSVVVVANPAAGITMLTRDQVSQIFLAKARVYPNGKPVAPINQLDEGDIRRRFETSVLGKDSTQVRAYWTRLLFSGRTSLPKMVEDDKKVIDVVASDPTAIGYIDSDSLTRDVVVVFREP